MSNTLRKIVSLSRVYSYEGILMRPGSQVPAIHYRLCSNTSPDQEIADAPAPPAAVEPFMDSFGRRHDYLRISLTERCNLRCQYCMPAQGVPLSPRGALLSLTELARLAQVFARGGVRKVRLTGGEPTLRPDLPEVVQTLHAAGLRVALTSNGVALARRLGALRRAGLCALNVSLDSLRAARYERLARRAALPHVLHALRHALELGWRPVKVNTVLIRGFNDDEICDFVELTRELELEVRFIEFMPFGGNEWNASKLVPYRDVLRAVREAHPALERVPPRGNDTATVWQVPGYAGSVGFIHSMTEPFCATCNRLRLTADGNLKVCLLGAAEVSLRDALRAGASDVQLDALVRAALRNKKARHAARPRAVLGARSYCTRAGDGASHADDDGDGAFSHLDGEGRARMVDVGHKEVTRRQARASCSVHVSARVVRLLRDARVPKGDALTVAHVAGALAAKRTAELLPLCHALALDVARVRVRLPPGDCAGGGALRVTCHVSARAATGVEMEALTGAAVAALALYDMCKSVDGAMRICDLRLEHKSGGRAAPRAAPPPLRAPDASPRAGELYAPTDLAHF